MIRPGLPGPPSPLSMPPGALPRAREARRGPTPHPHSGSTLERDGGPGRASPLLGWTPRPARATIPPLRHPLDSTRNDDGINY